MLRLPRAAPPPRPPPSVLSPRNHLRVPEKHAKLDSAFRIFFGGLPPLRVETAICLSFTGRPEGLRRKPNRPPLGDFSRPPTPTPWPSLHRVHALRAPEDRGGLGANSRAQLLREVNGTQTQFAPDAEETTPFPRLHSPGRAADQVCPGARFRCRLNHRPGVFATGKLPLRAPAPRNFTPPYRGSRLISCSRTSWVGEQRPLDTESRTTPFRGPAGFFFFDTTLAPGCDLVVRKTQKAPAAPPPQPDRPSWPRIPTGPPLLGFFPSPTCPGSPPLKRGVFRPTFPTWAVFFPRTTAAARAGPASRGNYPRSPRLSF